MCAGPTGHTPCIRLPSAAPAAPTALAAPTAPTAPTATVSAKRSAVKADANVFVKVDMPTSSPPRMQPLTHFAPSVDHRAKIGDVRSTIHRGI